MKLRRTNERILALLPYVQLWRGAPRSEVVMLPGYAVIIKLNVLIDKQADAII
jgi:hypothetical protein